MALAPIAVAAQDTEATAAEGQNQLGLPANVALLAKSDPNTRTATAVVNGQVITGTDIDQRMALFEAANEGQQFSEEQEQQLRAQVLRNLIDETLQIQAAKVQDLPVDDQMVQQRYAEVAARNFQSAPDALARMEAYLKSVGSSPASLKRQIRGEIAWQMVLRRNVQPFVNVSNEEVNEVLARMEASRGTEEYRIGEIFLSATPENSAAVQQNARAIAEQLGQGASFVAFARQYSEASTAAVGGDLGWVRLETLPAEMAEVARSMQQGQLVGPFAIPGGWEILYLIDKRQVLTADPRDAVLSLKQISLEFAPGTDANVARSQFEKFSQEVKAIKGCGDAEAAAARFGATVVSNDQVTARSLPEQLQQIVLNMQVGQATPPFRSDENSVRVLMLCGRDDPQEGAKPSFERMMTQLENERIDKRAQRYLRDLRNDAYIEYN
ncbi:peptidylprolyl isomerase [Qipengyuania sp.]|uniref:peptidylprolyl isomerase n=1 Tax=Qipengyuania sp. TaxID=2004515 RepID=UPI0035C7C310